MSYPLVSKEFAVRPWSGITVDGLRVDADGRVSFAVGPRHTIPVTSGTPAIDATIGPIDYPDTYALPSASCTTSAAPYAIPPPRATRRSSSGTA